MIYLQTTVCVIHTLIFKEVVRPQLQDHNRKGLAKLCLCMQSMALDL